MPFHPDGRIAREGEHARHLPQRGDRHRPERGLAAGKEDAGVHLYRHPEGTVVDRDLAGLDEGRERRAQRRRRLGRGLEHLTHLLLPFAGTSFPLALALGRARRCTARGKPCTTEGTTVSFPSCTWGVTRPARNAWLKDSEMTRYLPSLAEVRAYMTTKKAKSSVMKSA